jgi:uncharacterized protein
LEWYNGSPQLSTVACDRWADWSVTPVPGKPETITISIEKEVGSHGPSLWVYYLPADGAKVPLREICWVYGDNGEGADFHLTVGAYAARPEAKATKAGLEVSFKDLDVQWNPKT